MFNREYRVGKFFVTPLRQNRRVGKTVILQTILPARRFRCRDESKNEETPVNKNAGKKHVPWLLRRLNFTRAGKKKMLLLA